MEEENIEGEALDKGKNYVIREICKLDNSNTPEELKKIVFSELVRMKKKLKTSSNCEVVDPFTYTGAYSFSSFNEQE
tara:strand:+ start:1729 stop:1959 length:231 start_codon:yes stop_codon:yes gene_type:complete